MLGKLLKYDLKSVFKFLIIFYALSLFFSVLTKMFLSIENSLLMNIIGHIFSGTALSMMFSILINNLMRLWVKFKNNLYGDEAYLTHTLPLSKNTLYLSKIITALVSLFISVFVIGLSIFIAYYSKENIEILKNVLLPIATIYDSTTIKIIIAFMFIFFLEFLNILQCGFTGIILGHKMNNSKLGYSVLFGFISFIISQLFVLLVIFVFALFNNDIMNLFITKEIINLESTKIILYLSSVIYTFIIFITCNINIKLLKKGVNVE